MLQWKRWVGHDAGQKEMQPSVGVGLRWAREQSSHCTRGRLNRVTGIER